MDNFRAKKAQDIRDKGGHPYAPKFSRTHTLLEAGSLKEKDQCAIAGRIMLFRDMGKLTFATLQDHSGRLQIAFRKDVIGEEDYKRMTHQIDLGDFIGIEGEYFLTKRGEPTVLVNSWTMLSKALRQPPEKWHGLSDKETAWR